MRRNNLFQTAFANQIVAIEEGKLKYLRRKFESKEQLLIHDAMEAYWLRKKR